MPEGLTNAPAAFQRFMNDIFADMIDVNVIVYLDDILVYSDDLMEHKRHVREVLWRLHANGLFSHTDKCKFHVTSCEYFGYMLSPESVNVGEVWSGPVISPRMWLKYLMQMMIKKIFFFFGSFSSIP